MKILALLLLPVLLIACAPVVTTPAAPLVTVREVEMTQVVTALQTVQVTREQEAPITNTPTFTSNATATPIPTFTRTPVPSFTPIWDPPRVEIVSAPGTERSACWYGPSTSYLHKYSLPDGVWMRVMGRNDPGTWVLVKAKDDPQRKACWIQADLVKFLSGNIASVPVTWQVLPYSTLYLPPKAISASRVGNEVTIWWQPVWETEDDYEGYLVEAWVCQGGRQVFVPIQYRTSYASNQAAIASYVLLSVKVIDEPGCDVPSRARFYTVEKHGYTNYRMVPWPPFDDASALTPTVTPTPTATP